MNISISNDAAFRGQTFADMIAPLKEYAKAYEAVEQQYDTLGQNANALQAMIDKDRDRGAYNMYNEYNTRLNDTVSDFAKGMSASNRAALINLKRDYGKTIVPISNALKRRQDLADEQRKALAQDHSIMYQRDANTISLDELMANPSADYGGMASGNQIMKNVSDMVEKMSKRLSGTSLRGMSDDEKVMAYQYQFYTSKGYSPSQVLAAIARDPQANKALTRVVDQAVEASGVLGWDDPAAVNKAYQYANMGLWNAIGETDVKPVTDTYGIQSKLLEMKADDKDDTKKKKKEEEDPMKNPNFHLRSFTSHDGYKQDDTFTLTNVVEQHGQFKNASGGDAALKYILAGVAQDASGKQKLTVIKELKDDGTGTKVWSGDKTINASDIKDVLDVGWGTAGFTATVQAGDDYKLYKVIIPDYIFGVRGQNIKAKMSSLSTDLDNDARAAVLNDALQNMNSMLQIESIAPQKSDI